MLKIKKQKKQKSKLGARIGFSLMEVFISMGIISILASVSYVGIAQYGVKKRTAQAVTDLLKLRSSLENYYAKKGFYPQSPNVGSGFIWMGYCYSGSDGMSLNVMEHWISDLVPQFIDKTPVEPNSANSAGNCAAPGVLGDRQYIYKSDGYNYKIVYVHPEGDSVSKDMFDPQRPVSGSNKAAYGFWTEGAKSW